MPWRILVSIIHSYTAPRRISLLLPPNCYTPSIDCLPPPSMQLAYTTSMRMHAHTHTHTLNNALIACFVDQLVQKTSVRRIVMQYIRYHNHIAIAPLSQWLTTDFYRNSLFLAFYRKLTRGMSLQIPCSRNAPGYNSNARVIHHA